MTWLKKRIKKYSLDIGYFSLATIVALFIIDDGEIIDIVYLCLLTFCYIRIKIHRWRTKYLVVL